MKRRELKGIAKAIAQNEKVIASSNASPTEKATAMKKIEELSGKITSLEEMLELDELILDLMKQVLDFFKIF